MKNKPLSKAELEQLEKDYKEFPKLIAKKNKPLSAADKLSAKLDKLNNQQEQTGNVYNPEDWMTCSNTVEQQLKVTQEENKKLREENIKLKNKLEAIMVHANCINMLRLS